MSLLTPTMEPTATYSSFESQCIEDPSYWCDSLPYEAAGSRSDQLVEEKFAWSYGSAISTCSSIDDSVSIKTEAYSDGETGSLSSLLTPLHDTTLSESSLQATLVHRQDFSASMPNYYSTCPSSSSPLHSQEINPSVVYVMTPVYQQPVQQQYQPYESSRRSMLSLNPPLNTCYPSVHHMNSARSILPEAVSTGYTNSTRSTVIQRGISPPSSPDMFNYFFSSQPTDSPPSVSSANRQTTKKMKPVSCHVNSVCSNCGTKVTTLWRRNAEGGIECNACNLFFRKNNRKRPPTMQKPIRKRVRIPRDLRV